jgi:hypothetical protein
MKASFLRILNSSTNEDASENLLLGLFAVVGANLEIVRPFGAVKYRQSKNSVIDLIAVPDGDNFVYFERMFSPDKPAQQFTDLQTISPVPAIEFTFEQLPESAILLKFFER